MKKVLISVAFLLTIILVLSACAEPAPTTPETPTPSAPETPTPSISEPTETPTPTPTPTEEESKYGGTLRYLYPYSPTTIPGWPNDRANAQRGWTAYVLFEPLVRLDINGEPEPYLATSWEWGPEKKYITFTLRQDVNFHDGTPFTAEAVKLEGDMVMETGESNAVNWESWEIIDDYTVRLNLKQYQNDFWGTVTGINMMFFSPATYKEHGQEWMMEHPIGTGPFKFLSFEKDVSLKFIRNDDYWQEGKPYLDEIHFITVKETLTAQASLQAGEGDMLALQQGKILADMEAEGFKISAQYGGTDFLMFDTMNPDSIFNNINIRKAIEYALEKQAMADALGYGYLVVTNQMPPPSNPAHNPNIGTRDYDPEKAKQLLAEAGYPEGIKINMITVGSSGKDLAIQEYLKAVGIDVNIESVDNAKFWDYMMTGWENAMVSSGYAVGTNFAAWLKFYFPPTGVIDVSVKLPDEIIAKIEPALNETDTDKTKELNDELLQMMFDEAVLIPIYSNAMGYIINPKVQDSGIFEYVDFWVWTPADCWLSE